MSIWMRCVVREVLGHTRVTATERYTHVATLQMKDARAHGPSVVGPRMRAGLPRPADILDWPSDAVRFEDVTVRVAGFPFPCHAPDHACNFSLLAPELSLISKIRQ
jgi:hypothetical protein